LEIRSGRRTSAMSMTSVVFFDIGGTLGSVQISPEGSPIRLEVYSEARETLDLLRQQQVRMGIISNPGSASPATVEGLLESSGIRSFFDPALLVFGSKNSAEIFGRAAELAGLAATPRQCVFVGEDSRERNFALAAGFRVAPHPRLVFNVLEGRTLT
jgi:bacterial leucyl aminopeptidase